MALITWTGVCRVSDRSAGSSLVSCHQDILEFSHFRSIPPVLSTSRSIRDSTHSWSSSYQCHQSSPPADVSETPHTLGHQVINAISPLHQQTYPRLHTLLVIKSSMPPVFSWKVLIQFGGVSYGREMWSEEWCPGIHYSYK